MYVSRPVAPGAGEEPGRTAADLSGPGVGLAGVPDSSGPFVSGPPRPARAEVPAGESPAAGSDRAALLGPRRRALPTAAPTGRETGRQDFFQLLEVIHVVLLCADVLCFGRLERSSCRSREWGR